MVPSNFDGYNTTVNGFQDFFTGSSLANYSEISAGNAAPAGSSGNFTLPGDGTLHINGGGGDPNKLLYSGAAYNPVNQDVLAMIKVLGGSNNDGFRSGIAIQSDATNGKGVNELFRQDGDNGPGNHVNFLDDGAAWGPVVGGADTWSAGTYYWLHETVDSSTGVITAKIWAADGSTQESDASTATWDSRGRSGLAGLVADSVNGDGTFQVNYLLIRDSALPSITAGVLAVPEPSTLALSGCGLIALAGAYRRHRRSTSVN